MENVHEDTQPSSFTLENRMTSMLASHRLLIAAVLPVVLAVAGITPARAQPAPQPSPSGPQDPYDPDQADDANSDEADEAPPLTPDDAPVAPATPPPTAQPPAPPAQPAAPPPAPAQVAPPAPGSPQAAQPSAAGQWVYTQQRGWLWMPYGEQYVYTPPNTAGAYPSEYVYAPSYGWTWVSAPWVWGWGPELYFSYGGPVRYHWFHGRGFVWHGYRGGYGVIRGPGYRGSIRGYGGHYSGGHYGGSRYSGGHYSGGHYSGGHFGGGHVGGGRGHR